MPSKYHRQKVQKYTVIKLSPAAKDTFTPFISSHLISSHLISTEQGLLLNPLMHKVAKIVTKNNGVRRHTGLTHGFWPTVLSVEPLVHCVACLSVCLSSVVCDVLYGGKMVHPSEKVSEGVNRKPGSKSSFFGSTPYFYFRFRRYGHQDCRFCFIFARTAKQLVPDGRN